MTELEIKRRASVMLQKGRYDEAISEYQALIDQSKKQNPAILNLIGDIHVKKGDYAKGFEAFFRASRLYADEGLFHNAIAVGKKILRLDKEQVEVYRSLGIMYARQGLGMDCVKFLNEYHRLKAADNNYPAGLAAFAEATELLHDVPEVQIAYGQKLETVDRLEDAAACYEAAAQAFQERRLDSVAQEWRRKAKLVLREGEGIVRSEDSIGSNVNDLMSLRSLDGEPIDGGSASPDAKIEDAKVRWSAYDPTRHPDLPPPPPLPTRGGAAPPAAPPDSVEAPKPGGLELELTPLSEAAPPSTPSTPPAEPIEANADDGPVFTLDFDLAPLESGEAAASPDAPDSDSEQALEELPGIIMPPSGAAPAPPAPAGGTADRAPAELPPLEISPFEPVGTEPPVELPPLEPAAAESPAGSPPRSPSESAISPEAGLDAFFQTAQPRPTGDEEQQAVVIGDDFELVREGGDVSEVISDFREATMEILDLDDFQSHYDLGTTYMEMELFDEAAAEFEIAARGDNFALASREMLGYCFLRKGMIDLAIRELKRGLEISGYDERDKIGLLYNLGIACGVMDRESEAIEHFQRILEVDPGFRDTRSRLERLVQNSH